MTYIPENLDELQRKTQRNIKCENCGQRRTIDGYDEPTIATCVAEHCQTFFVIPSYPFTNEEIQHFDTIETALEEYLELKDS